MSAEREEPAVTETVTVRKDDLRLLMEAATGHVPIGDLPRVNEALKRCGEALAGGVKDGTGGNTAPVAEPVHLGEYARVDIMGHDWRVGYVSDGSLAGAACLDVRDGTGALIAKIPPHSVYLYRPLEPPRPGEPAIAVATAIEAGGDAWAGDRDDDGEPF